MEGSPLCSVLCAPIPPRSGAGELLAILSGADLLVLTTPKCDVLLAWIAFGATVSLLAATLVFLNVGADLRRGQYPFVVGLAGSWLVILNPVYFLLADHRYLNSSHPQDVIVLLLTIVGVMLLICAASWNASVDKLLKKWWSTPKGKMASMDGSGVHVSVSVLDEDEDDGVTVPESPRSR